MTDDVASPPDPVEVVEIYEEAHDQPIAGGRWEILTDDKVRYVRPSGEVVVPAMVSANTLRGSPSWRRVR